MAQWVDMEAEKSRTERMSLRDPLFEADLRLLICWTAPRGSKTYGFYFLTPPCLPIDPLGGLVTPKMYSI